MNYTLRIGYLAVLVGMLAAATTTAWSAPMARSGVFHFQVTLKVGKQAPRRMDHWIWASGDRFRIETTWPSGKRIIVGDQSYADMITLGSREVVRFQGDAIGYPLFTPVASWNEVDSVRLLNQWSRSAQFDMGECGTATFVCTDSAGRNLMVPGEPSRGRVKLRYWANPYEPGPTCYEKIAVFASDSETTMKLVSAKADAPVTGRLFHLDLPTRAAIRVVALPEVVRQYPDRLR